MGRGLAKVERARDVSRAAVVLATAVHQQHASVVNGGTLPLLYVQHLCRYIARIYTKLLNPMYYLRKPQLVQDVETQL